MRALTGRGFASFDPFFEKKVLSVTVPSEEDTERIDDDADGWRVKAADWGRSYVNSSRIRLNPRDAADVWRSSASRLHNRVLV